MKVEFEVKTAERSELSDLHDVISTTGWGITVESIDGILTWDPQAYLVARDRSGRAIGAGFGVGYAQTGWIGHLVVRPESQGLGVGKAIFDGAVARLASQGKSPLYLTATVMGEPLYTKRGFAPDGGWSRWRGLAKGGAALASASPAPVSGGDTGSVVSPLAAGDLDDLIAFDTMRFGDDRGVALRWLVEARSKRGYVARRPDGPLCGFVLEGTEGVGPFVAEPDCVAGLFAAALDMYAGQVVSFTFPDSNRLALSLCEEAGLEPFRTWKRMRLGPDTAPPRDECIFNASVATG